MWRFFLGRCRLGVRQRGEAGIFLSGDLGDENGVQAFV